MSEATVAANAFVAAHLRDAARLGERLADLVTDPVAFQATLARGLGSLADDTYAAAQERVAPGSGTVLGVRWPLLHEIGRTLRPALRETSSSLVLDLATRLARTGVTREERLMALPCLRACPSSTPARPARAAPTAQTRRITRSTSIPDAAASDGLSATARVALPSRVPNSAPSTRTSATAAMPMLQ
jgi:hypothetical protein